MSSGFEFDTAAFERGLTQAVKRYEVDVDGALDDYADDAVDTAKSLAPVETGETVASIRVQAKGRTSTGPFVDVGSTLPKTIHIELGTEDTPPQPFMRPAIAQAAAKFGRGIR